MLLLHGQMVSLLILLLDQLNSTLLQGRRGKERKKMKEKKIQTKKKNFFFFVFLTLVSPSNFKAHSLASLLKQVSALFSTEFSKLLSNKFDSHPYESLPVPFPGKKLFSRKENQLKTFKE